MSVDVEKVVRENIDRTVHLSLATSVNNIPWICELHFAHDEDLNLYFISLEDRRHSREIAKNSKVAGSIIDNYAVDAEAPLGIYFEGDAKLVSDSQNVRKAAELLNSRIGLDEEYVINEAKSRNGHKVYMVSVKNWAIFGKFDEDRGTKHELEWGK